MVRLQSARAEDAPMIDPNDMSHKADWQARRAAIRRTREIFSPSTLAPYADGEITPGSEAETDDAELDAFITQAAESAYHPACTSGMGSGADAVVDGGTAVHGVEGLNVVDASIMAKLVSGHLNAPAIMLAAKAADLIAGRDPLPPADVLVWMHPQWQSQQR